MILIGLALFVVIVIFLLILVFRRPAQGIAHQQLLDIKDTEHAKTIAIINVEKDRLAAELMTVRQELMQERERLIKAEEAFKAQRARLAEQEEHLNNLHQRFKLEFENIASKVLDEKTAKFTIQNKENLDVLLTPLKENIRAFEEKVDHVYKAESAERNKLEGVLKAMMDQSRQIQSEASNLTKALKGDNKKQGNWGEIILERVLERSGLVKDREYRIQARHISAEGARFFPDVVVDLPDEKHLIIDSKIALTAYERMVNCETEQERVIYLKQHLQSIKAHIDGLSAKQYQNLYNINSPDFVLLFMPVESSFSITVQTDHDVFNYAWDKKVVIVSPTTLLATLRTIASIWKVDRQNKNVFAIAEEAGALYDKFVGFLEDMDKVSKNLGLAQRSHEDAFKKLHTGSGNLVGKVEKIKALGAKTKSSKQIDSRFLEE